MRILLLVSAAAFAATTAVAQSLAWDQAQAINVELSSFAYAPATVRLPAGRAVRLVLVNTSGGGHNFAAPEFFAAATVRPEDRAAIQRGAVEVSGRTTVTVALVPRAGRYRLRCTHLLHSSFGMTGEIVVE